MTTLETVQNIGGVLSSERKDSIHEQSSLKRRSLMNTVEKISAVSNTVHTSNIDFLGKKTQSKVFGYFNKRKVEKVVSSIQLIVTFKGFARTAVSIAAIIVKKIKSIGESFLNFNGAYGLAFDGLSVATAAYSLYDDSIHAYKAFKSGDGEEFRDRSSEVVGSSTSISSDVIGAVSFAEGLKETAKAAATSTSLGIISGSLGVTVWGIFFAAQVIAIKRITKAINSLKSIFYSEDTENEKYVRTINYLKSQLEVRSDSEEYIEKIENKLNKLKLFGQEREEKRKVLLEKLLNKKHNHFKKRAGEEASNEVQLKVHDLYDTLNNFPKDSKEYIEALAQSKVLVKKYRQGLNKELALRIFKTAGAIIGIAASLASLFNPIAGGIIAGAASGVLLYAWYQSKYKKAEDFKELSIFGYKLFNFESKEDSLDQKIAPTFNSKKVSVDVDDIFVKNDFFGKQTRKVSSPFLDQTRLSPVVFFEPLKVSSAFQKPLATKGNAIKQNETLLDSYRAAEEFVDYGSRSNRMEQSACHALIDRIKKERSKKMFQGSVVSVLS